MENKKLNRDFSFVLFHTRWYVKYVDQLYDENDNYLLGLTNFGKREILIALQDPSGKALPEKELSLTLLHEVMHSIFMTGQYTSATQDEPLVEWCSRCLYSLLPIFRTKIN